MSKKSCEAAESIKDALLRMARVNCNFYLDLKGFLSMILFKKFFAPIARSRFPKPASILTP